MAKKKKQSNSEIVSSLLRDRYGDDQSIANAEVSQHERNAGDVYRAIRDNGVGKTSLQRAQERYNQYVKEQEFVRNTGNASLTNPNDYMTRFGGMAPDSLNAKMAAANARQKRATNMPNLEDIKTGKVAPTVVQEAEARLKTVEDKTREKLIRFNDAYRLGDVETQSKMEAEIKASKGWDDNQFKSVVNDFRIMSDYNRDISLGQKINGLTDQQEYDYAQGKIEQLSQGEQDALKVLMRGQTKDTEKKGIYGESLRGEIASKIAGRSDGSEDRKKAVDILTNQYGWDDAKIKEYSGYTQKLANKTATSNLQQQVAINPNASTSEKFWKSVGNTGIDLMNTPTRGVYSVMSNFEERPEGFGRDTNSWWNAQSNISDAAKQQVVDNAITSAHPYGQKAYQIGMSTAESAELAILGSAFPGAQASGLAGAAARGATLVPFAADAYNAGYKEARERGAIDKDAQLYGIAAGMAEAGTELVSLDHLWSMTKGTKLGSKALLNFLAQAGIEGSEEAASDILNRYSDYLVLGSKGQNQMTKDIEEIMAANPFMTREQAANIAEKNFWKMVGEDALAGTISGGVMGAGGVAVGVANYNANEKAIAEHFGNYQNEGTTEYDQQLRDQAKTYAQNPSRYIADTIDDSTEAGKIARQKAMDRANGKSGFFKTASLNQAIENAQSDSPSNAQKEYAKYAAEVTAVPKEYRTAQTGITAEEGVAKMQEAADKGDLKGLSDAYSLMKNSTSAEARDYADEALDSMKGRSDKIASLQIEGLKTTTQDAFLAGANGTERSELGTLSQAAQEAYDKGKIQYLEKSKYVVNNAESVKHASVTTEDGGHVLTGKITNGMVVTESGDLINIADTQGDSNIKTVYGFAAEYNDDIANTIMNNIQDGDNVIQYTGAAAAIISAGETSIKENQMLGTYAAKVLGEDRARALYQAGARQAVIEKHAGFKVFNKKVENVDVGFKNYSTSDIDASMFDMIAKVMGISIELWDQDATVDGRRVLESGANAKFVPKDSKIIVSASNAGQIFHELGEFMQAYNSEGYDEVRKALVGAASEIMGADVFMGYKNQFQEAYANAGQKMTDWQITSEMANDLIVDMMSTDKGRKAFSDYLAKNYSATQANSIKAKIKEWYNKIIASIRSLFENSNLSPFQEKALKKNVGQLESNMKLFLKEFDTAIQNYKEINVNNVTENVGITYDADTESAYPEAFSLNTFNASDYVTDRQNAAKSLAKALNVPVEQALKYIDDVNSIAKIIADDRVRLDFDAEENSSSFVSNAEYGGSIDFSTICKKRLLYTGTMQEIQKQIGNRVITMEDYLAIRNAMLEDGLETTCGCCYVEGSRVKLGQFMKEFIKRYSKDNPSYIPTMYDVTMPDGIRQLRAKHPEVFEAREKFLNNRGVLHEGETNLFSSQGKPKDYTERTEYRGEILDKFLGKKETVAQKNLNGGLRLQSFSDFEIVNLLDCMQVITDMARCGLAGQAYTKVYNFADALGNTGLKINLSLMGAGVDANGDLVLDEINGMKKADAIKLRNKYSKNVGTIIVCFTDEQIKAAMKSDYIDFIIPFHRSQWRKSQYDALGLPEGTRDYTMHQNDRTIKDNGRLKKADRNYMPNEYWEYDKSGRYNAEKYIDMCNKDHKAPKFPFLLNKNSDGTYSLPEGKEYDGYFKLLIDFKMYDNDGVGAPQIPVTPNFSMEEAKRMLNEYAGGHDTFPVAKNIADRFAKEIIERGKEFNVDVNNVMQSGDDIRYSIQVTDPIKLDELENQEHIKVYRTFQKIGDGYYAPMNATEGKGKEKRLGYESKIGQWEQATEITDFDKAIADGKIIVSKNGSYKFNLDAGKYTTSGKTRNTPAAYNPYLHSSNLVFNDQFTAAYDRPNLVVVECEVPVSEETSGYHAEHAKDPVGWIEWKNGSVATALAKKGIQRKVFLSRYMKPVRELSNAEVADIYKSTLEGTDIVIPWNVVSPPLRKELEARKVPISYDDIKLGSNVAKFEDKFPGERMSLIVNSEGNSLTEQQAEYFKDSKVRDENGNLLVMYHGTKSDFTVFDPRKFGGVNGIAEGYGIYLTDNSEVSKAYGSIMKVYANVTNPASSDVKSIKASQLSKLIEATCKQEATRMMEEDGYDKIEDALKDTWISNYVYTYDMPISKAYMEVANQIIRQESSDFGIIQEVMSGMAIRSYEKAYDFYDVLKSEMGIDGFATEWEDPENPGKTSKIVLAFDSNQVKNVDNASPTLDPDIRYSITFDDFISDDELSETIMEELEDDIILDSKWNTSIDDILAALEESINSKTKRERKKAQRHLTRAALGKEFQVREGKTVALTDERIEKYMHAFAASNKDYAQAYITYMSPADFLLLTANGNKGDETFQRIKSESHELDWDQFKGESQPIFLDLDEKGVGGATKNEIIGHEGRHRMFALQMAGYTKVPVLVFNYANKYSKSHIDRINVDPQRYNMDTKYNASNKITLSDLEVLSTGNQDTVIEKFGSGAKADVRYSLNMHHVDFDDLRNASFNVSNLYIDDEEFYISDKDRFRYMASKKNKNLDFYSVAYSYNHIFLYNNYSNTRDGYNLIAIIDADDVEINIHEADRYGREAVQKVIDEINEVIGDDKQIHRGSGEFLVLGRGMLSSSSILDEVSRQFGRGDNGDSRKNQRSYSIQVDDSSYMSAVESGDMATAQRMVDEAAAREGFNVKAYHGSTKGDITIFRTDEIDNNMGSHFGSEEIAKGFAEGDWSHGKGEGRIYSVYLKAQHPFETYDWFAQDDFYPMAEACDLADTIGTPEALAIKEELLDLDPQFREMYESRDFDEEYLDKDKAEILYRRFRDLLELGGYDSIKYENGLEVIGDEDYIIQHPEQIKLADPVTYDDNGNVIPLSQRFNAANPDIRYSLQYDDFLMSDEFFSESEQTYKATASILEEGMEALKHQKVDKKVVTKIASKLISEFGSTAKIATVADELTKAFAYMQTEDHVSYGSMMRVMSEIARPIIDQATTKVGQEVYDDFLETFRGRTIRLSDRQKQEVAYAFGSYQQFRLSMAPLQISDKGTTNIEDVWSELAAKGYVDLDTTTKDMPLALYDLAQSLKPVVENEYGEDIEEASKDLAMRIVEEYLGTQEVAEAKAVADKAKEQLKQYRQNLKDQYKKNLQKVRADLAAKGKYNVAKAQIAADWREAELKQKQQQKIANLIEKQKEELARVKKEAKDAADYQVRRAEVEARWREAELKAKQDLKNEINAMKIDEIRAKNKQRMVELRDRQKAAEQRKAISKTAKELVRWIENPTEQNHVPSALVEPILSLVDRLDFLEPRVMRTKDGQYKTRIFIAMVDGKPEYRDFIEPKREKAIERYRNALGVGVGSRELKSWVEIMANVQSMLDKAQRGDLADDALNDVLQLVDPDLSDEFSTLLDKSDKLYMSELGADDLKTVNKFFKAVRHAIVMQNKTFTNNGTIKEWAESTLTNAQRIRIKDHTRTINTILKNLTVDMFTPETFFSLQGESGEKIFKALNDAFETRVRDIKQASEYMQDAMKGIDKKDIKAWRGAKARVHKFQVYDGEIELTEAQIMSLYELNKRAQAVLHYRGGVMADVITKRNKGLNIESKQTKAVHLTDFDIENILSVLTDEQRDLADRMQWYLANVCAEQGNEASRIMYDYEKFTDPDYFPITTDKTLHASTNSNNVNVETLNGIERMGMTKQVNPNADTAIVIRDIFEVFTNHVTDMAAYHGYAPAIKDSNRWFNYKTRMDIGEGFNKQVSVKQAVNSNMGRTDNAGVEYYEKLIKDINGSEKSGDIQTAFGNFVGNYKAAAVAGNLSVVAQQPGAIVRAFNEIDAKYLLKAMPKILQRKQVISAAKEVSPTVWWKTQGYYETSIGKSLDEIITGNTSIKDKIVEATMIPAGIADDLAWSVMYTACEYEVSDTAKGMNLTDEEYRARVNDRFKTVIARTQVVDATLQKSQWMRGKGDMSKLRTAFMAEPTKTYNMVIKSMILDERQYGKDVSKWNRTYKAVFWAAMADIFTAGLASFVKAARAKKDDDEYWEKFLETWKSEAVENLLPWSKIPIIKDMIPQLWDAVMGKTSYGSDLGASMDMMAVSSILDAISTSSKLLQGSYDKTPYAAFMTYAKALSNGLGIPAYNISRDLAAIYNLVADEDHELVKTKPKDSDKYNKVFNAIKSDEDLKEIEDLVKRAVEKGGTIYDIQHGISSRFKSDYFEAFQTDPNKASKIGEMAAKGFAATGMSDEEIESTIEGWQEEAVSYKDLDASIKSGEGINEALDKVREAKEDDKIIKHLDDRFRSTVEYSEREKANSIIKDSLNEAYGLIDGRSYTEVVNDLDAAAAEKAAKQAADEQKAADKDSLYATIDNGGSYKTEVDALIKDGLEPSKIKSAITSKYKDSLTEEYKKGKSVTTMVSRIATVRAYCDKQYNPKIAASYNGDYYKYEHDEIMKWFK